jgi:hypothetical protein
MSINDRDDRSSGGASSPLFEPRVDPGVNTLNPKRVSPPSQLSARIPRGADNTKSPARMPVKR